MNERSEIEAEIAKLIRDNIDTATFKELAEMIFDKFLKSWCEVIQLAQGKVKPRGPVEPYRD